MALWEGFLECLMDFASRSDHPKCLLEYVKTQGGCINPETTKHLLSIGPGTGEIDHGLVSLLPHLTSYTAVDPHVWALDTVKGRLEEYPGIEKHYVNSMMEAYTGPQCGADIILMSHVCYYFGDSFTQQIGRALSWLNKEGGRILLVHDQSTVDNLLASEFGVQLDSLSLDDLRCRLVDMGVNFTESAIDYTLDVSYPGPTYYGFLSVILKWRATKEEVDKALSALRPAFIAGTQKVMITQSVFVIDNTSNTQDEK